MGLESYALESRRLGVTDRARSEDTAHEVVEEVLHVATTLRDMAEARTSETVWAGTQRTAARTYAQCSGRPTPTRTSTMTAGKQGTPCALRERCERLDTGADVRREAAYEPASAHALTDKQLGAGRRLGGNLHAGVFNSILHIALDQEDVAQRTAGNAGKTR